jgi:hypothetical protein
VRAALRRSTIAAALALPLFLASGCGCQIGHLDRVFLIDSGTDGGVPSGTAGDAASMTLDCAPTASACVNAGDCRPACECVLQRIGFVDANKLIDSCALEPNAAAPSVRVKYREREMCPPY